MVRLAMVVLLSGTAIAQDVPADRILLARVLQHVGEEVNRQRDVSCLETISREFKPAKGKMKPLDTVQLEVLTDGHRELYASPGGRSFSQNPPIDFVGSGAIGNGFFSLYLSSLVTGGTSFFWKGFEENAGHRLARWDYAIPIEFSGQSFALQEGSGKVSLHGSFWAEPDTFNVVRLAAAIGDIPATLPLASSAWSIDYAPTTVAGNLSVLLPQTAEWEMTKLSGEASRSHLAFTQCRTFAVESSLNFNDDAPTRFAASSVDDTLRPLPAGLEVPVKLTTPLKGEMTVGALIDGVVPRNVVQKGRVAIPAGSPVRGRIRRLERYTDPQNFYTVAIEYTELSIDGIRYRFDAVLRRVDPLVDVMTGIPTRTTRVAGVERRETIRFADLPGVATFFVGGDRLDMPAGLQTVWTTGRRR